MLYSEAAAQVDQLEHQEGFMKIELSYNTRLVLPHSQAIIFLELLRHAEFLEERYGAPPVIRPVGEGDVTFNLMAASHRRQLHMAQLLNVPVADLEQLRQAEEPPPF